MHIIFGETICKLEQSIVQRNRAQKFNDVYDSFIFKNFNNFLSIGYKIHPLLCFQVNNLLMYVHTFNV